MKNCYIYIRTATQHPLADKTHNGASLQRHMCLEYARKHNYNVLEIFQDIGVGGNTLKRKDWQRLLTATNKGSVLAVIVSRIDRISRNIADLTYVYNIFKKKDIELISVTEGGSKNEMLTFTVAVAQSEPERKKHA